ncbi:MAG: patatin-like phospholipase family protein [Rhodanobacteraceae bacterium]|nr:patatin-like phospholipase family protein [Rhodanobacteraceae bacterium]
MLVIQAASQPPKPRRRPRIGLAVAGGGPLGGIYELGALCAIQDAIHGLDTRTLDVYVGVSSGAFISAGLANQLSPAEMCRIFLTSESHETRFRPELFVQPALWEYLRRSWRAPGLLLDWLTDVVRHPLQQSLTDTLVRLGSLLPTGLFDNEQIEVFLRGVFTRNGRSNDFRTLSRKLYVIAVELDSGKAIRFGSPGYDDVPISRAIQASSALPGLYPPVRIADRYYVDGALQRTLHASVALDAGADLVLGINPLVPFDATQSGDAAASLVERGLPAVLSQTFRTLLQSRVQASLSKYRSHYANADVVLFEPNADDVRMFFSNVFSYDNRLQVAEHAYRSTLTDLRSRRSELEPLLARHGLALDMSVLDDDRRTLRSGLGPAPAPHTPATARLREALDELEALALTPRKTHKQQ